MEFNRKGREIATNDDNQDSIFLQEELVTEILLRLDIRALFRSKLVSKRWNSIISHPKFAHCYLQRASSSSKSSSPWQLWGILDPVVAINPSLYQTDNGPPFLYAPLDKSFCPDGDLIMASSGGLILSASTEEYYCSEGFIGFKEDIRIFNPLTKQSAKLPLLSCHGSYFSLRFGLVTPPVQPRGDHPAYVTYKIVVIQDTRPYRPVVIDGNCMVEIYTFSSDIGRWTRKKMATCLEVAFHCSKKESFNCKGILHWFNWDTRSVITYDPYNSPDRFGRIQLPSGSGEILENAGMNPLRHFATWVTNINGHLKVELGHLRIQVTNSRHLNGGHLSAVP